MQINISRPWLYDLQNEAMFNPCRFSLVAAGTKSGKTFSALIWISDLWWKGKDGWHYWWVAPTRKQAKIAFNRFSKAWPKKYMKVNYSDLWIENRITGTVIEFRTGEKPDGLYGEDVYGAVIDEHSRCRAEAWHAVNTTLTSTMGPCRLIGNVRGKRNWTYELERKIKDGTLGLPDWSFHKMTTLDAVREGVINPKAVDDAKAILPEAVFEELYMAVATEDGANPFGREYILANSLGPGLKGGDPVCWGWDLARKGDWAVGIALDAEGHVVRFKRFRENWPRAIDLIIEATSGLPTLADATGVGDPIVQQLQARVDGVEGFIFTSKSKQDLMEALAVGIQHQVVTWEKNEHEVLISELEDFEYEHTRHGVRYSSPPGYHDDCVDSLALAYRALTDPSMQPLQVW